MSDTTYLDGARRGLTTSDILFLAWAIVGFALMLLTACTFDDPALAEEQRRLLERSVELLDLIRSGAATDADVKESVAVATRLEELRQLSTGAIDWTTVGTTIGEIGASVLVTLGLVRRWRGPINDRRGNIPAAP